MFPNVVDPCLVVLHGFQLHGTRLPELGVTVFGDEKGKVVVALGQPHKRIENALGIADKTVGILTVFSLSMA